MPDFWRRNVTAPNQWLQNCILFFVRSTNFSSNFQHKFHAACINQWLGLGQSKTCPLCRSKQG